MKITKVNAMKIGSLILYLSTFFMTFYKLSILGVTHRFYIQSAGAGGFMSFVLFFVIFYNMYLFVVNRYYAKDVFVGIIVFTIFMWVGLLASFPPGAGAGASMFFQFIFIAFMILVAAREDIAVQIYDVLERAYYDAFPNAKKHKKQYTTREEKKPEPHYVEHRDMDFEKLKKEHKRDYYNDRVLNPSGSVYNQKKKAEPVTTKKVEEIKVEEPIIEPVYEPVIEPAIDVKEVEIEKEEVKVEEPKEFTLKAPKIENPFLKKPDIKK